jgi:transcriptional regulator GlxA family with amidase domain
VPSLLADGGRWATGRHPELIDWIARMNAGGAILASACSGLFPLADRTFARRFTTTAGLSPIADVQRLRVEDARRRLERTDAPVERIAWEVGYEDPAAFRRLFRRLTGLAPGAYRRRFQVPAFAQPPG